MNVTRHWHHWHRLQILQRHKRYRWKTTYKGIKSAVRFEYCTAFFNCSCVKIKRVQKRLKKAPGISIECCQYSVTSHFVLESKASLFFIALAPKAGSSISCTACSIGQIPSPFRLMMFSVSSSHSQAILYFAKIPSAALLITSAYTKRLYTTLCACHNCLAPAQNAGVIFIFKQGFCTL